MMRPTKLATMLFPVVLMSLVVNQAEAQRRGGSGQVWKFLAEKYDSNNDGKLSKEEYDRSEENFKRFDTNKDGFLTEEDWAAGSAGPTRRGRRGGKRKAESSAPSVGDQAPDFILTHVSDESKEVKLSSFSGDKPVALIFGSCT